MNQKKFKSVLAAHLKREFERHIRFDKGASKSVAERAAHECPMGTIRARLPWRRKLRAYCKALRVWWAR
ncbi:hypothetical protein [Castellaniella sp.]|uniref:hypothetical protein n=1 Tax=Castellaniella sp. TaxID=1955812 RepID=UPI002AFE28EF|nr:hypothetical protein [Castellaniella sp.]